MKKIGTRLASALLLSALGLAGGGVQAAGAAPSKAVSTSPAAEQTVSLPGYRALVPAGSNWTITGSITVPDLTCPAHGFAEIEPALFVSAVQFDNEIHLGEQQFLTCKNGVANDSIVFLTRSRNMPIPMTLSPGDTLNVTITDDGDAFGTATVTVRDGSQQVSASDTGLTLQFVNALAAISCDGAPGVCPPWPAFPHFGTIAYSSVTVNGMTLRQLHATGHDGLNGASGFIKTSVLDKTGAGFTLTWRRS